MEILDDEKIDDLQLKGLKIIQKKKGFRFGIDAVLLADFADVKEGAKVLDLGTGTGIITLLIAGHTIVNKIIGLEIQEQMSEMAQRSVIMNGLESIIEIINGDIKESKNILDRNSFDVVVSNPPYIKSNGGLTNSSDLKAISRHEIKCSLEDVIISASLHLKQGGQFSMVNRPERLVDILFLMRKYSIEPKCVRFVYPKKGKNANLVLIKGTNYGRPELKVMNPLYIYDENGKYTDEIDMIYNREGEK